MADVAQTGTHSRTCQLQDALTHHLQAIETEGDATEEGEYEEYGVHVHFKKLTCHKNNEKFQELDMLDTKNSKKCAFLGKNRLK